MIKVFKHFTNTVAENTESLAKATGDLKDKESLELVKIYGLNDLSLLILLDNLISPEKRG